jgi:hypothetical protein
LDLRRSATAARFAVMRYPVLLLSLGFGCASVFSADAGWKPIWNEKNLNEWTTWLGRPQPASDVPGLKKSPDGKYAEVLGPNRDPLRVFTVVDVDGRPAIRISGEVFGELRSKRSFENYHLRLQFKWGEKKWPPRLQAVRDSGLLYHAHTAPGAEGRTWARSIELQIQERDVGDLFSVGTVIFVRAKLRPGTGNATTRPVYDYDPKGGFHVFAQVPGMDGRCVKQPDNEKPFGEWNTVELVCLGSESIHIVNGKVVMRLHNPTRIDMPTPQLVTSGPILLQSEGAEIFYRDLAVRSITTVPKELAGP